MLSSSAGAITTGAGKLESSDLGTLTGATGIAIGAGDISAIGDLSITKTAATGTLTALGTLKTSGGTITVQTPGGLVTVNDVSTWQSGVPRAAHCL